MSGVTEAARREIIPFVSTRSSISASGRQDETETGIHKQETGKW